MVSYQSNAFDTFRMHHGLSENVANSQEYLKPVLLFAGGSIRYPTAPACMEGIFPSVGPLSGGTNVSILVSGQLPPGRSKPPVCVFGSLKVNGKYSPETSTITCTAPAAAALSQPGTVALTVSLDGKTFTPEGAAFTYYCKLAKAACPMLWRFSKIELLILIKCLD